MSLDQDFFNKLLVTLDSARLPLEELQHIDLRAMRLDRPEQTPIPVAPVTSEGVPTGDWQLDVRKTGSSPWLVYSSADSPIVTRPLLWQRDGAIAEAPLATSLHAAVAIADRETRTEAIQTQFDCMCEDDSHSGWEYLQQLWSNYRHVPISTFDVWSQVTGHPRLLAACVLRLETDNVDALTTELPVMWETIPLTVWAEHLDRYAERLREIEVDTSDVNEVLVKRIESIESLSLAMRCFGQLLKVRLFPNSPPPTELAALDDTKRMRQMVNRYRQQLVQRHADSRWPTLLQSETARAFAALDPALGSTLPADPSYRSSVLQLPFVLAAGALDELGEAPRAHQVFKLRLLKQFDEDWFAGVFNVVMAYWLQQGGSA